MLKGESGVFVREIKRRAEHKESWQPPRSGEDVLVCKAVVVNRRGFQTADIPVTPQLKVHCQHMRLGITLNYI